MRIIAILLYLSASYVASTYILDTSRHLSSRKNRAFLVWQPGGNHYIQMIIGIGLPRTVNTNSVTYGTVFKSYYLLPQNSSYYTNPPLDIPVRRKRSTLSRWQFYSILQSFAESIGFGNVRSCLLRAICEVASVPFDERTGMLAELLRVVLTPSSTDETVESHADFEYHSAEKLGAEETGKCGFLYPECNVDFLARYTKFLMHDLLK